MANIGVVKRLLLSLKRNAVMCVICTNTHQHAMPTNTNIRERDSLSTKWTLTMRRLIKRNTRRNKIQEQRNLFFEPLFCFTLCVTVCCLMLLCWQLYDKPYAGLSSWLDLKRRIVSAGHISVLPRMSISLSQQNTVTNDTNDYVYAAALNDNNHCLGELLISNKTHILTWIIASHFPKREST